MDVSRENHELVDTGKGGVGRSKSNIEYTNDKTNDSGTDLDAGKKVAGRDLTKSSDLYNSGKCNTLFLPLSCANFLSNTVFSYSGAADVSKRTRRKGKNLECYITCNRMTDPEFAPESSSGHHQ